MQPMNAAPIALNLGVQFKACLMAKTIAANRQIDTIPTRMSR